MVARLNFTDKGGTSLLYNEKKVLQNDAVLIHSNGFLTDPSRLEFHEKLERFDRLNELNNRAETNMLHASLNFDPREMLTTQQLSAIADRYMAGLNMQDQPYLVYQHTDAGHPHIHLISSLIRPDGDRIETHNLPRDISEPTRKAIEEEFGLIRAGERSQKESKTLEPDQVQRAEYGKHNPTKQAMRDILQMVGAEYNFTSFEEYNAILRQYNVLADRGKKGSATYENGGLVYRVTDDEGKKKSAPVKASDYSFQPTLVNLEKLYTINQSTREQQLPEVREKIDQVLFQGPASFEEFKTDLRPAGIELFQTRSGTDQPTDLFYIDHQLKMAVDARQFPPDYQKEQLHQTFQQQQRENQEQNLQQDQSIGRRISR